MTTQKSIEASCRSTRSIIALKYWPGCRYGGLLVWLWLLDATSDRPGTAGGLGKCAVAVAVKEKHLMLTPAILISCFRIVGHGLLLNVADAAAYPKETPARKGSTDA